MKLSRVERLLREEQTFVACIDIAQGPRPTTEAVALPHGVFLINQRSPLQVRRVVEAFARMFQREFRYDFVQYNARERTDARDTAFLWERPHTYPDQFCGAAVFRWRKWSDTPEGYALAWVWLHPHVRRSGLLTEAWPYFKDSFGDFHVEPPLSPEMSAFVRKVGEAA